MATYSKVGTVLECIGAGITSADILTNLNALGIGSGHFGQTSGNKPIYFFNASIQIGNSTSSGASSVWDCSNEVIKINAPSFHIFGSVIQGQLANGTSKDGGAFVVTGTSNDSFRLFDNGIFRAYGSMVYAQDRIRVDTDTEFTVVDCDFEPEDSVSTGEAGTPYGSRQSINYGRTRIHNTGAVGVKLYSFYSGANAASFSLSETKVEDCLYAFQLGEGGNLAPVLKDVRIDSCTYHLVPNLGDSDVTFINPDFTNLRTIMFDSNDIAKIAFRYKINVQDNNLAPINNAKVIITDGNNDNQSNSLTNASGQLSTLPTFDGETVLFNATYAGTTRTDRAATVRAVASYPHNLRVDSFTINADFVDNVGLSTDTHITETDKSIVDAYPVTVTYADTTKTLTISGASSTIQNLTAQQFYDAVKAYLVDNYAGESETIVTRVGGNINARALNVVLDYITMTGGLETTGTVSLTNGSTVSGGIIDATANSFLSFSGIVSWRVYGTEANRDADASALATGVVSEVYRFNFVAGTTYYLRLYTSAVTFIGDAVVPTQAGRTDISLDTPSLISALFNGVELALDNARAANAQTKQP